MELLEMQKKQMKDYLQSEAEVIMGIIKLTKAAIDMDEDLKQLNTGDLLVEVLIEELEKLRKPVSAPEGIATAVCALPRNDTNVAAAERCVAYMSFGGAIDAARRGERIARKGWNGKGQYVELACCISYRTPDGCVVNAEHEAIGNAAFAFVGTSGVQLGWLASQADMLATDWYVVDDE